MHCPNCETDVSEKDQYCHSCGHTFMSKSKQTSRWNHWWWLPILSLVVVLGGLTSHYVYEKSVTQSALTSFHQGEQFALKGNYDKAEERFIQSLTDRKHFAAAHLNKKIVGLALDIRDDLDTVEKERQNEKFKQALQQLDQSELKLQSYKGPVTDHLRKNISQARMTTMVAQLRHDMKGKSTIEALSPILTRAESLKAPEAGKIAKQVRTHIVKLAYAKANDCLKENQFADATTAVQSGLLYDQNNAKLLNLKKSIKEQQEAFSKAEQNRLQQALDSAQKEQNQNRHNAVKLIEVSSKLNDSGNLTVTGKVKNIASVPISLITITYTLYDPEGNVFKENKVYVSPNMLYPGEKGSFEYTHFQVGRKMTVKVNRASWYIN